MKQIPFIVHKQKLFKEQRRYKFLLLATNIMWLAICLILIMR